jgi:hypothetical protein
LGPRRREGPPGSGQKTIRRSPSYLAKKYPTYDPKTDGNVFEWINRVCEQAHLERREAYKPRSIE